MNLVEYHRIWSLIIQDGMTNISMFDCEPDDLAEIIDKFFNEHLDKPQQNLAIPEKTIQKWIDEPGAEIEDLEPE